MKETLSVFAGLLAVPGYILYIRAILQKKSKKKPARVSWFIWAGLDVIVLAGMFFKKTINTQIVIATIGAFIVSGLAINYGTPGWKKLDIFCIIGAIVGVGLWKTFNNPLFGIIMGLASIFIGSFPTFVSAWEDPSREDKLAWSFFLASPIFTALAIPFPHWTLSNVAQPITFSIISAITMFVLCVRPRLI